MSASVPMMGDPAVVISRHLCSSRMGVSSCQLSHETCHTSVPILETS